MRFSNFEFPLRPAGKNQLACEERVPCSAEGGGWAKKRICEAKKYAQTGWCWSSSTRFLDQHHPGASRHPSSAEEGTLLSPANSFPTSVTAHGHRLFFTANTSMMSLGSMRKVNLEIPARAAKSSAWRSTRA